MSRIKKGSLVSKKTTPVAELIFPHGVQSSHIVKNTEHVFCFFFLTKTAYYYPIVDLVQVATECNVFIFQKNISRGLNSCILVYRPQVNFWTVLSLKQINLKWATPCLWNSFTFSNVLSNSTEIFKNLLKIHWSLNAFFFQLVILSFVDLDSVFVILFCLFVVFVTVLPFRYFVLNPLPLVSFILKSAYVNFKILDLFLAIK